MDPGNATEIIATVTKPYIDVVCGLGEAPYYEEASRTVRFVDIVKKKAYRFHIDQGQDSLVEFETKDAVSITYDIDGVEGKHIVAAKYGFAIMDSQSAELSYIARAWNDSKDGAGKSERMRFNDGNIDPAGRFFAGSMTDPALHTPSNEGALFRLDPDRSVHKVISPVQVPNGIGWTADGKTMYFTDSPTLTIWAFDYNVEDATMTNRRPWYELAGEPEGAEPDGFALDERGDVWSAVFGGSKVIRLRDVGGKAVKIGEVGFPTRCITCPRFVGTDLIVTSAEDSLPDRQESSEAMAGRVFRVNVGVKGAEIRKWRGSV